MGDKSIKRFYFSSLRSRLILIILLTLFPIFLLILYNFYEQRRLAFREIQTNTLHLTQFAVKHQGQLIEGTRHLLIALLKLSQIRQTDSIGCSSLFAEIRKEYPHYGSIGASKPNGDMFCSGYPMIRPVNSSEQVWFQDTIRTQNFSVGVYQISRIRDKPVIVFGYPVIDETGKIKALVWAGMDLAWLNQSIAKIDLPEGATLVVFDRDGTILARRPDPEKWVGQSIQKVSYFKTILDKGRGTVEAPGVDGIKRLYAFTTLEGLPEGSLYVKVGIPTQRAYAYIGKALMRNLTLLGLIGVLSLAVSWFISTFTILKPVSALIEASRRMAAGDLGSRAGLSHHKGEIGQLAQVFNEMGESLQKQENNRKRAEEALRESGRQWSRTFDAINDSV
ncbi:MAG: hypothetical protein COZ69_10030 [Deltaproteobacteria bacterium CG_4_8_14_3_um_filter_45_9]|nr:MAG: hypothetical protein COS40_09475 [Deltaproteobacteria bacterium CG03_land_8_20_14_0_80_45_14]PIX22847.1 MAG: hypothetical protein COZ69_10030 [Deltaproteobacteria bacterium CG_4_8_14_3_um_filter_45_9]